MATKKKAAKKAFKATARIAGRSKLIKGAARVASEGPKGGAITKERGKRIRDLLAKMKARVHGAPKGKANLLGALEGIAKGKKIGLAGKVTARSTVGMSPTRARRIALLRMAERASAGGRGGGG